MTHLRLCFRHPQMHRTTFTVASFCATSCRHYRALSGAQTLRFAHSASLGSKERLPVRKRTPHWPRRPLSSVPHYPFPFNTSKVLLQLSIRMEAQTSEELPSNLKKIVGAFQMVTRIDVPCWISWGISVEVPDAMARYKQLLFFASKLDPLPEEHHTEENRVQGCVSQVQILCESHWVANCVG